MNELWTRGVVCIFVSFSVSWTCLMAEVEGTGWLILNYISILANRCIV